jgi:hypothetical protein
MNAPALNPAAAPLEFHPLANLFPLIEGPEFDALVADIKANGLRDAILLYEGKILDGRNRYRACLEAGIERARYHQYRDDWPHYGNGGALGYVLSRNLHRRHLTTEQRAAIAAELATMKSGARTDLASNDARSTMSDAQAAKALKVSESSVERAKKRMREDPEAHEQAKAGTRPKKPCTLAAFTPRPVPETNAQIAEHVCMLCNRLAEDAQKITPETLLSEIAGNVRFTNNIGRSLSPAVHLLGELQRLLEKPEEGTG